MLRGMTDLANVWVRTSILEMIRADRIISLSLSYPVVGDYHGPAPAGVFANMKSRDQATQLGLMASVACGAEPRDVHLGTYEVTDAVPALNNLARALGTAVRSREATQIVYPAPGTSPLWGIETALPREWIAENPQRGNGI